MVNRLSSFSIARHRLYRISCVLGAVALTSACGYKGPLTLPPPPAEPDASLTTPPTTQPASMTTPSAESDAPEQ